MARQWPEPEVEALERPIETVERRDFKLNQSLTMKLDEIKAKLREIAALLDELEPGDVTPQAPEAA